MQTLTQTHQHGAVVLWLAILLAPQKLAHAHAYTPTHPHTHAHTHVYTQTHPHTRKHTINMVGRRTFAGNIISTQT